jgi:sec-independent protein translocase protein TatC
MPLILSPKQKKPKEQDERPKYSGDPEEYRLTLVEHLEELRDRIIKSLYALGAGWLIGWYAEKPVYAYLSGVINRAIVKSLPNGHPYIEQFAHATDAFFLKFKLSFLIGVILAFPYIILQLWGFVAPALKPNEQKPFKRLAPASAFMFILGVGFAWFITPNCMSWFVSYVDEFPGTALFQEAGTMVFFVLKLLLAFGVAFQLPLIVYGMGLAGILEAETLIKYWRQSAVTIFVVAMIVTPSQDPATMLAMAIPLCLLFMISVYAVKLVQRKKPRIEEDKDRLDE